MGENLKIVWAEFSTLSQAVFVTSAIASHVRACPHLQLKTVPMFQPVSLSLFGVFTGEQIIQYTHRETKVVLSKVRHLAHVNNIKVLFTYLGCSFLSFFMKTCGITTIQKWLLYSITWLNNLKFIQHFSFISNEI